MGSKRDIYGRLIDPGEMHQEFMLGLFDLQKEMEDFSTFSKEALSRLQEVRLMFMVEFKKQYPGHGKGRALWNS